MTETRKARIKIAIFASIHGDKPARPSGLVDFAREADGFPGLRRSARMDSRVERR